MSASRQRALLSAVGQLPQSAETLIHAPCPRRFAPVSVASHSDREERVRMGVPAAGNEVLRELYAVVSQNAELALAVSPPPRSANPMVHDARFAAVGGSDSGFLGRGSAVTRVGQAQPLRTVVGFTPSTA